MGSFLLFNRNLWPNPNLSLGVFRGPKGGANQERPLHSFKGGGPYNISSQPEGHFLQRTGPPSFGLHPSKVFLPLVPLFTHTEVRLLHRTTGFFSHNDRDKTTALYNRKSLPAQKASALHFCEESFSGKHTRDFCVFPTTPRGSHNSGVDPKTLPHTDGGVFLTFFTTGRGEPFLVPTPAVAYSFVGAPGFNDNRRS